MTTLRLVRRLWPVLTLVVLLLVLAVLAATPSAATSPVHGASIPVPIPVGHLLRVG